MKNDLSQHSRTVKADTFGRLHRFREPLLLANVWDAGSARVIERCGVTALATTSGGLAWSHGYPDGDALPPATLARAVAEIARVISVPLSVDLEGGYSDDPRQVKENVAAVIDAGAVGINIEDGNATPDLLIEKIAAAKEAARTTSIPLFVNARTDVYLHRLVPRERMLEETLARASRYRAAGCDGLFVPGVVDPEEIRVIANETALPLNVMILPKLPTIRQLTELGVRRVSAATWLAKAALDRSLSLARQFLQERRYDGFFEVGLTYEYINALFLETTTHLGEP